MNFGLLFPSHQKKIRPLKDFCNIYVIKMKDLLVNILLNSMLQEVFLLYEKKICMAYRWFHNSRVNFMVFVPTGEIIY
ncbi:hypothetical protein BACI71_40426 [Bacillus mycoides]|uniref:Uncharacterized protein n=1 Tax=Bacillus mycoides TaxID=1405 RepID=A0A654A309_BACMY|nr:hypothetical protein BACI71_40426 [Bacillus mycoides]